MRGESPLSPRHTWALSETTTWSASAWMISLQADRTVERIPCRSRGQWIRQGQKVSCTIPSQMGSGRRYVSPVEGTGPTQPRQFEKDPKLALRDPFGEGWLVTVNAPDPKTSFKNLLGGPLARWWMEESASRLQRRTYRCRLAASPQSARARRRRSESTDVSSQIPPRNGCRWPKNFSCPRSKSIKSAARPRHQPSAHSQNAAARQNEVPQKHRPPDQPLGGHVFTQEQICKRHPERSSFSRSESMRSQGPLTLSVRQLILNVGGCRSLRVSCAALGSRLKLYAFCSLNRSGTGAAEAGLSCTAAWSPAARSLQTLALAGAATFSLAEISSNPARTPSEAL